MGVLDSVELTLLTTHGLIAVNRKVWESPGQSEIIPGEDVNEVLLQKSDFES